MEGWEEGAFHDNIQLRKTDGPALDLLNVRYILTLQTLPDAGLNHAFAGNDFQVYERKSEKRGWAAVRSTGGESAPEAWKFVDQEIEIQQYKPHEIVFSFSQDKPADLRVAEWYYPGWEAEAVLKDGQRIPVVVDCSPEGLRVLRLPAGVSQARMFTRAWLGWIVSSASRRPVRFCWGMGVDHPDRQAFGYTAAGDGRYYAGWRGKGGRECRLFCAISV